MGEKGCFFNFFNVGYLNYFISYKLHIYIKMLLIILSIIRVQILRLWEHFMCQNMRRVWSFFQNLKLGSNLTWNNWKTVDHTYRHGSCFMKIFNRWAFYATLQFKYDSSLIWHEITGKRLIIHTDMEVVSWKYSTAELFTQLQLHCNSSMIQFQ